MYGNYEFLSKFKLNYLWKMHGYPQFSFWILIALAKTRFSHSHKPRKNVVVLVTGAERMRSNKRRHSPQEDSGQGRGWETKSSVFNYLKRMHEVRRMIATLCEIFMIRFFSKTFSFWINNYRWVKSCATELWLLSIFK